MTLFYYFNEYTFCIVNLFSIFIFYSDQTVNVQIISSYLKLYYKSFGAHKTAVRYRHLVHTLATLNPLIQSTKIDIATPQRALWL